MIAKFRKLFWTEHSKIKMRQYGLSRQKLLGILAKPERKEQGIVPGTTAVMRTNPVKSGKTASLLPDNGASKVFSKWRRPKRALGEIWIMYKDIKMDSAPARKIISAWRYPGVSKPGEAVPIPEDIRNEILSSNF